MAKKKPMTHKGNLTKTVAFGKTSTYSIELRETSKYWICKYGTKYDKRHGTEVGEKYNIGRLDLSTIQELKEVKEDEFEIDPSTLAIHFPDMLASDSDRLLPNGEKDLRIFASLSEDGKGGDKLDSTNEKLVAKMFMGNTCFTHIGYGAGTPIYPLNVTHKFKVTGIQQ